MPPLTGSSLEASIADLYGWVSTVAVNSATERARSPIAITDRMRHAMLLNMNSGNLHGNMS